MSVLQGKRSGGAAGRGQSRVSEQAAGPVEDRAGFLSEAVPLQSGTWLSVELQRCGQELDGLGARMKAIDAAFTGELGEVSGKAQDVVLGLGVAVSGAQKDE